MSKRIRADTMQESKSSPSASAAPLSALPIALRASDPLWSTIASFVGEDDRVVSVLARTSKRFQSLRRAFKIRTIDVSSDASCFALQTCPAELDEVIVTRASWWYKHCDSARKISWPAKIKRLAIRSEFFKISDLLACVPPQSSTGIASLRIHLLPSYWHSGDGRAADVKDECLQFSRRYPSLSAVRFDFGGNGEESTLQDAMAWLAVGQSLKRLEVMARSEMKDRTANVLRYMWSSGILPKIETLVSNLPCIVQHAGVYLRDGHKTAHVRVLDQRNENPAPVSLIDLFQQYPRLQELRFAPECFCRVSLSRIGWKKLRTSNTLALSR